QSGVRRYAARRNAAVAQRRWNVESDLAAGADLLHSLAPARNHRAHLDVERSKSWIGAVKDPAVRQTADVIHFHELAGFGMRCGSRLQNLIAQSVGEFDHVGIVLQL